MFYIYADGEELYFPTVENLTVLSPMLTKETGKSGSLSFRMPPSNKRYADLKKLKTIITVELDDLEIFRGRVLTEDGDFNNVKTVYCEGNLAYLVDSVQKSVAYTGKVHDFFTKSIAEHNARVESAKQFVAGNITVENRDMILSGKSAEDLSEETDNFNYKQIVMDAITTEWKTTYDRLSSCLIDNIGGYLQTRRVGDKTYIDYLQSYAQNAEQTLSFGVNMLDLSKHASAEDAYSVLIPLGDDNLTIADVNNGSDELVDDAAVSLYGRIVRTHVFDSVTSPATLLEDAKRFLANRENVPFELEITAVDLSVLNPDLEPILLGNRVKVKSAPHGIVDELTCYKISYDLENPANTVYTFGTPTQTLTERYKKDKAKAADAAENGAASGGGGGGSAASEATDAKLQKAYAEWVNWDPTNPDGHVSLGALWQQLKDAKIGLQSVTGINLDATEDYASFNIFSRFGIIEKQGEDQYKMITGHDASIKSMATALESKLTLSATEYKEGVVKKIASIELSVGKQGSQIALKADKVTIDTELAGIKTNIATFSGQITTINSEITKVKNLVADEINAVKANVDWLKGKIINASELIGTTVIGQYVYASKSMYINGNPVATQDWVAQNVSWGNVSDGFVWLNLHGTNKRLAMANHVHSQYLTSLPSHRHSISLPYGKLCRLSNGSTGWCVEPGTYNTGYS